MPWEIDYAFLSFTQLKKTSFYLSKDVEIKIINIENETTYGVYKSNDKTGKLLLISPPNKEYRIIIDSPGYERLITNVVLDKNINILYKLALLR